MSNVDKKRRARSRRTPAQSVAREKKLQSALKVNYFLCKVCSRGHAGHDGAHLSKGARVSKRRTPRRSHCCGGLTRGVHMASGLQLNVLRCCSSLEEVSFLFSPPRGDRGEGGGGGGGALWKAAGLGWQQSGQRVVGLWLSPLKTSFKQKAPSGTKAPPGSSVC